MAPSAPSQSRPANAPILGVVPNSTASVAPSPHPLEPSPAPPSSDPVVYFSSDPASPIPNPTFLPQAHPMTYSPPSRTTITISLVIAVVVGIALLVLAIISVRVCRRKKKEAAAAAGGANLFRSSTFGMRPPPGFGGLDSASTSKEAFAQYPYTNPSAGTSGIDMTELPQRPPSAYSGADTPPIRYADSPQLPPMPFQSYGPPRPAPAPPLPPIGTTPSLTWTRSPSSGLPPSTRPLIAPVLSSSPEQLDLRTPPVVARIAPEPRSDRSLDSFTSTSTPSFASTPGTQTSHETIPTPPISPLDRALGPLGGPGGKLSVITNVPVAPLRIPLPAARAQLHAKPDFARLLFAAGLQTSPTAPGPLSPTPEEAEEDVFTSVSPLQTSHSTPIPRNAIPIVLPGTRPRLPSIVVTSPGIGWEEEMERSPSFSYDGEGDYEEDEDGLRSDEEGSEGGPFDSPISEEADEEEEEDIVSQHHAITLSLGMYHPAPLPNPFPSTVSFPTTLASVVSPTPSPLQSPPPIGVERMQSPAEFPQSPLESEMDEEDYMPSPPQPQQAVMVKGRKPSAPTGPSPLGPKGKPEVDLRAEALKGLGIWPGRAPPAVGVQPLKTVAKPGPPQPLRQQQQQQQQQRGVKRVEDEKEFGLPKIMVTEWFEM